MSVIPKSIDYTNKDYESFRYSMLSQIPVKCPEWTDYKESDFGVVIIELLSYCLDVLSYYQDRSANECFIDTAKLRQSVISLVKLIGYSAKGYFPSEYDETFTLSEAAPAGGVVIPKGFKVSTLQTETELPIIFEVKDSVTIAGGESSSNIRIIQGETVYNEIIGSSTGEQSQVFTLKQKKAVIDDTMFIYVKESGIWAEYTRVNNFIDSVGTDRHYVASIDDDDITYIEFGNGAAGKIPPESLDSVRATYRICEGSSGTVGVNSINQVVSGGVPLLSSVTNASVAIVEGVDKETITEIKENAIKANRTKERAVTDQDFEDLVELYTENNQYIVRSVQSVTGNPYLIYVYLHSGVPEASDLSNISDYLFDKVLLLDSYSVLPAIEEAITVTGTLEVYQNYLKSSVISNIDDALAVYFSTTKVGIQPDLTNDIISVIKAVEGVKSFSIVVGGTTTIAEGHIAVKGTVTIT